MPAANWKKAPTADNGSVDIARQLDWRENMLPPKVNDSARILMAEWAKWRDDQSGALETAGTSTAYTLITNQVFGAALPDSATLVFRLHAASGASATLAVDGQTTLPLRISSATAFPAASLEAGALVHVRKHTVDGCYYIKHLPTAVNPIASGGTGGKTPAEARQNLGVVIGTNVQAYDEELATIAGLVSAANKLPYFTGSQAAALADFNALGRSLVGAASTAAARAALGGALADAVFPGAVVAILEEQRAQNTASASVAAGSDQTRVINAAAFNRNGVVALASNQFTLPAGQWEIGWSAPVNVTAQLHQSWLYDVTGGAEVARGTSMQTNTPVTNGMGVSRSDGAAVVTLAASTTFEIRHRTTVGAQPPASTFGPEVYTRVVIRTA
jgi:hypothetical protein